MPADRRHASPEQPDQPPSPEPKRNTAHDPEATPAPKPRPDAGTPDDGTRPDDLTTENDDGQG